MLRRENAAEKKHIGPLYRKENECGLMAAALVQTDLDHSVPTCKKSVHESRYLSDNVQWAANVGYSLSSMTCLALHYQKDPQSRDYYIKVPAAA